jgi:hypothetical protein
MSSADHEARAPAHAASRVHTAVGYVTVGHPEARPGSGMPCLSGSALRDRERQVDRAVIAPSLLAGSASLR